MKYAINDVYTPFGFETKAKRDKWLETNKGYPCLRTDVEALIGCESKKWYWEVCSQGDESEENEVQRVSTGD